MQALLCPLLGRVLSYVLCLEAIGEGVGKIVFFFGLIVEEIEEKDRSFRRYF
jgi:hypothetical protein